MAPALQCQASEELLKQHYIDLKDRPFFPGLVKYMGSGPVVAMVSAGAREGGTKENKITGFADRLVGVRHVCMSLLDIFLEFPLWFSG